MFFDCYWVVGIVFDCCVVGDDYVLVFGYLVDFGDDFCVWGFVVVYVVSG